MNDPVKPPEPVTPRGELKFYLTYLLEHFDDINNERIKRFLQHLIEVAEKV